MECNQCEAVWINGIFCHETGCPDAWKSRVKACSECGCDFVPEFRYQRIDRECGELLAGDGYQD